jgi:hypothetical protein
MIAPEDKESDINRLELPQMSHQEMVAANGSILEAGLRTQNHDKGLDKYVRMLNAEEESSAVVAIESGWQGDHGWAVAFKQNPQMLTPGHSRWTIG